MSKAEEMSVRAAKRLYRERGLLILPEDQGAYDALYEAGYTMRLHDGGAWAVCIELERGC